MRRPFTSCWNCLPLTPGEVIGRTGFPFFGIFLVRSNVTDATHIITPIRPTSNTDNSLSAWRIGQVGEAPIDPIHLLGHLFDQQVVTCNCRLQRGADQMAQHGQVESCDLTTRDQSRLQTFG